MQQQRNTTWCVDGGAVAQNCALVIDGDGVIRGWHVLQPNQEVAEEG